jgi:hypothetical protein
MGLIPTFVIGVWNAWIPAIFILLHPFIMNIVDKIVGTGNLNEKMGDVSTGKENKLSISIPTLLLFALFCLFDLSST